MIIAKSPITVAEHARFTVYRLVSEYVENQISNDFWGMVKMIKNCLEYDFINKNEAEMLCKNLNITFDEMKEES